MAGGRMMTGYRAEFCLGFGLLAACLAGLPVAFAQDAQYPPAPQLKKDGTSVLLEDYASLPFSSLKKDGPYPSPIDYQDQLGRANSLRSEPADAPNSDKRFFVPGQNGVLYILDKSTRQFTPMSISEKSFPSSRPNPSMVSASFRLRSIPVMRRTESSIRSIRNDPASADPPRRATMPRRT